MTPTIEPETQLSDTYDASEYTDEYTAEEVAELEAAIQSAIAANPGAAAFADLLVGEDPEDIAETAATIAARVDAIVRREPQRDLAAEAIKNGDFQGWLKERHGTSKGKTWG